MHASTGVIAWRRSTSTLLLALGVWAGSAMAQTGSDARHDAAQLGADLTAIGADRAGNADGSIPAFSGGLRETPAGLGDFFAGVRYPDPYTAEAPQFTITRDNLAQYAAHLSDGQQALFRNDPEYRIVVYPTHRTAAMPSGYEHDTIINAQSGRARLAENGNGITGTTSGIPFPVPRNGLEAIWNALTRYRGESYETQNQLAAVTRDGSFTPVTLRLRLRFIYGAQTLKPEQRQDNLLLYFLQQTLAPARLAGSAILVHETLNRSVAPRSAWVYNPGTRRVRLAPDVGYDNPAPNSDGLRTDDDFGLFSGATDRYDWTLLGKREIYVQYNEYRIASRALKLQQLLTPRHVNQALTRYELHRVWVVEANLKKGTTHLYSKRRFYLDEDSWTPLLSEEYDMRGALWRVGENHLIQLWDVPTPFSDLEVLMDLHAGRYVASRLYNNSERLYLRKDYAAADFAPERLRQLGLR